MKFCSSVGVGLKEEDQTNKLMSSPAASFLHPFTSINKLVANIFYFKNALIEIILKTFEELSR
jgi:hypothetical protein